MNSGMLWFDNDPKSDLSTKIFRAASYFQHKYGRKPDLCFIHPSMLSGDKRSSNGIEICPSRSVQPHHLWIGTSDLPQNNR